MQAPQNSGTKNEEKEKMRRQKQGRRLQEINARRREEKVLSAPFPDPLLGLFVRTGSLNSNDGNEKIT